MFRCTVLVSFCIKKIAILSKWKPTNSEYVHHVCQKTNNKLWKFCLHGMLMLLFWFLFSFFSISASAFMFFFRFVKVIIINSQIRMRNKQNVFAYNGSVSKTCFVVCKTNCRFSLMHSVKSNLWCVLVLFHFIFIARKTNASILLGRILYLYIVIWFLRPYNISLVAKQNAFSIDNRLETTIKT